MRSRNIKPGFYKNESLAECSVWARYLFPGLWMMADRLGRMEDRPKRIKAELLAYDSVEVEPLLQELLIHGHILRYEVGGNNYIQILNFTKHQNPHHTETASIIPEADKFAKQHSRSNPSFHPHSLLESTPLEGGVTPKNSESSTAFHTPSLPPDSLIPDSLIQHHLNGDVRARETKEKNKLPNLSRLPFDSLPPEWSQWVHAEMGWSADVTADVWACFRDYWQGRTGKTAQKSDWGATWRNWCRKENIRNSGGNNANSQHYHQNARPNKSERAKAAIIESAIELGYMPYPRSSGES